MPVAANELEVFSDFCSNLQADGSCRLGNRKQVLSLLPCFTLVKVVYEVCISRNTPVLSLSSAPSLVLNAKANFRDRAHRKNNGIAHARSVEDVRDG